MKTAQRILPRMGIPFQYGRETFYLVNGGTYQHGNEPVLKVLSPDGGLYAVVSVNVTDKNEPLQPGEYCIKTWTENEMISKALRESGLFEDTGKRHRTGFVEAEVWKLVAPWPEETDNG